MKKIQIAELLEFPNYKSNLKKMKIILVEDEIPAMEKLERYILQYDVTIDIVARLTNIIDTVNWIENQENEFDIAFMDIQLSDGLSFDVFDQIKFKQPVIFVTAFDEYAIDAFKTNSIDYLLKPIRFTDVSKALNKYKNFKMILNSDNSDLVSKLQKMKKIKDRFLVRLGNHIHSIQTKDIALFYAEGRDVFLVTFSGKKFMMDFNLENLIQLLDTKLFFRISRTYIVNLEAIADVIVYSNNRLKINPKVNIDGEIIISRSRVSGFKNWFEGN